MGPGSRSLRSLVRDDVNSAFQIPNSQEDTRPPSRGAMRPSCAETIRPEYRGRRECRALGAPAAARGVVNTRVSHHGHTGNTRHSPRNGFNGVLRPPPGARAFLSPSSGVHSTNLTASLDAAGRRAFTVPRAA